MYREIRDIASKIPSLQNRLRDALLAEDTETISQTSGAAQAITVELLDRLKALLAGEPDRDVTVALVDAALSALNHAWAHAEKVALGTSVREMRARLLDFKTEVDRADAYLRVSIGAVDET